MAESPTDTQSRMGGERRRSVLMLAIDILDEKKREVAHQNIEAWFTLFHAKQYLLGNRPRAAVGKLKGEST